MHASLSVATSVRTVSLKCLRFSEVDAIRPYCRCLHNIHRTETQKADSLRRIESLNNEKRHKSSWSYATKYATEDKEIQDKGSNSTGGEQLTEVPPNIVLKIDDAQNSPKTVSSDKNETRSQRASMRHFSLHFPKSSVILNVDIRSDAKEVSFHIPDASSIINVKLDDVPVDETNPSQHIESVDDRFWYELKLDRRKLVQYYLMLSKIRLTGLVVVTTMAGYAMAPAPFHLGAFLLCTAGTTLTSCSANALNQYFEVPFDSQMNRTKNRVLVRGYLSPLHAVSFAVISGSLGLTILTVGVNPLTAALGAFNLGLYSFVYTPMKRYSIANTWVGSVVGALPPVMGWTACTGSIDAGALLLSAIMYAWQFPHFNALSWNLRPDYSRSGYRMTSVVNPALCKRVALRYSAGMIGLCTLAPVMGVTSWTFAVDSFPLNAYLTYLAWQFYKKGDSNSSRKLFRFTLGHIPALLILFLVSKKALEDKETDRLKEQKQTVNIVAKDAV